MMRWILLIAILLFVCGQIVRMRPTKRDQQLQVLRKAAMQVGLTVRFWTRRNSGYNYKSLPESGFIYLLPWPPKHHLVVNHWAVWLSAGGDIVTVTGAVPDLAQQWLLSFRTRFADAWALLEYNQSGIALLWQERGGPDDVKNIADALDLLRKNLDALPG